MDDTYSSWTALIYVFNLIVGTGALTLPAAFSHAGWALGVILMCCLAFVSYVTTTFVVESMATTNAMLKLSKLKQMKRVSHYLCMVIQASDSEADDVPSTSEYSPLCPAESLQNFPSRPRLFYTIDEKIEMGEMAAILFSRSGRILFFLCFSLYLFGDLSIYAAAVGKSLVDAACVSDNFTLPDTALCWPEQKVTRLQAYRIFLSTFLAIFGPFAFFNVQKTKYLQFATTLSRWLAFGIMITLAVVRLLNPKATHGSPVPVRLSGFPALLGSCVYSFMCHHSLPALLSPISDKSRLNLTLVADYALVLTVYLTLAVTAVFGFPKLQDLYTLNFIPHTGDRIEMEFIEYFLTLFPVFTLSASFPIVAVTLRNNLQAIFAPRGPWMVRHLLLPVVAVVPPVLLAMATENLETLVGITGSYAGAGIQYIIPAALVLMARASRPTELQNINSDFASPFSSMAWPVVVIIWAIVCICLVTINIVSKSSSS